MHTVNTVVSVRVKALMRYGILSWLITGIGLIGAGCSYYGQPVGSVKDIAWLHAKHAHYESAVILGLGRGMTDIEDILALWGGRYQLIVLTSSGCWFWDFVKYAKYGASRQLGPLNGLRSVSDFFSRCVSLMSGTHPRTESHFRGWNQP